MSRRVVVTGIGAVCSLGNDVPAIWDSVRNGKNGITQIRAYDAENRRVKLASQADIDFSLYFTPAEIRKMDRYTLLGAAAAAEAFEDSGINKENADFSRCGVMVSSGIGGLATIEREHSRGEEKGFDRVSPFFIPMVIPNMAAARISMNTGFTGYSSSVVTACAGGTNALGDSMRLIRHGYADIMLCGGAEGCITPLAVGGFTSMNALSESDDPDRASIPFDKERTGFVIGEGAGILILEEYGHALARGAKIYAEISGYGASCDAYHITSPDPDSKGAVMAVRMALEDAGLVPEDISYINAHGTSTPLNDKYETSAVREVFGKQAYKVPVSSTKSMTGHLLGASGAVEAIISLKAIQEGIVPPTINYRTADPECDLDCVPNQARKADITHAMSNSFGFGGHNASVIISKTEN